MRCIRLSQEYCFLILDSFQYEPIFIFPRTFSPLFKPPVKVCEQLILDYGEVKCGMEPINPSYILVLLLPSLPDHLIQHTLKDSLQLIQPLFCEMSISQDEVATPKSTDRSFKQKKILRPEIFEKLSEQLEGFFSTAIYKLYPYFLYEDEDPVHSAMNYITLTLPIGLGAIGCYLPLTPALTFRVEQASNVMYHDSTVTVHEILTLDPPSSIILGVVVLYKGHIVLGNLPVWETSQVLRLYNTRRMYVRNDTFPQETWAEKVKNLDKSEVFIGFVATRGLVIATVTVPLRERENDYDPWLLDKGKRLAGEMHMAGVIDRIEAEFWKNEISVEKDNPDIAKRKEFISIMQKSRSLDSSPIGSPRGLSNKNDKLYVPKYLDRHDIYVFHYALVDMTTLLVTVPSVNGSALWNMGIMRPLMGHYSGLCEKIGKTGKDYLEVHVKFGELLESEKVAAVKYRNFRLYAMYRGKPEKLKQFLYELVSFNLNY